LHSSCINATYHLLGNTPLKPITCGRLGNSRKAPIPKMVGKSWVKLDKTASILSSMKNSVIIKMLSKADNNLYIGKHTGVDHENSHFQATVPHLIFSSVWTLDTKLIETDTCMYSPNSTRSFKHEPRAREMYANNPTLANGESSSKPTCYLIL
jgi:hypothetical protein